ncbi:MAG: hypothetical protein ACRC0R_08065 [Cetobacterium sp.]
MRLILLFLTITNFIYAAIIVKVVEPLDFKNVEKIQIDGDKVIARGYLEITTTKKDEELPENALNDDYGKLLKIKFPTTTFITNNNNSVTVEKISLNDEEKDGIIFKRNGQKVEILGVIDKKNIDSLDENVEGEYIGYFPMEVKIYEKVGGEEK